MLWSNKNKWELLPISFFLAACHFSHHINKKVSWSVCSSHIKCYLENLKSRKFEHCITFCQTGGRHCRRTLHEIYKVIIFFLEMIRRCVFKRPDVTREVPLNGFASISSRLHHILYQYWAVVTQFSSVQWELTGIVLQTAVLQSFKDTQDSTWKHKIMRCFLYRGNHSQRVEWDPTAAACVNYSRNLSRKSATLPAFKPNQPRPEYNSRFAAPVP